ncbi:MAG TPA: rhomboid family intramembrane serine protease, partial [Candidatus Acidoferrales bacterium]|nr:rhomboid family intramembrane serine protease [Candidatus Acidoferrales bacterium]
GLRSLWSVNSQAVYRLGLLLPWRALSLSGEWWRLVTAMFLHGGIIHIGFNMMVLYQIGPAVEELYGSARYLFIYLVTGVAGFVLSSIVGHYSLGASGALLGLVGILLAVTSRRGGSYMRQLRSQLISSVVILFALGLFGGLGVDNWAHGGGLAAGFLLGRVMVDREPSSPSEKRVAAALGWLSGAVIIACFVLMLLHFNQPLS